jgi:hypothetical protein
MSNRTYNHVQKVSLDVGLLAIYAEFEAIPKKKRMMVEGHEVHVTSLRLRTFYKTGTKCYICGKEATHFAIDNFKSISKYQTPHMNLWGVREDGSELLFTHDHVIDRAKGGADSLKNTKTCCTDCNNRKNTLENYS